jgi:hypothetical protein
VWNASAKRFRKVESATALIWKVLLVAESRFRKLNAPELMQLVYEGVEFVDGNTVTKEGRRKAEGAPPKIDSTPIDRRSLS